MAFLVQKWHEQIPDAPVFDNPNFPHPEKDRSGLVYDDDG